MRLSKRPALTCRCRSQSGHALSRTMADEDHLTSIPPPRSPDQQMISATALDSINTSRDPHPFHADAGENLSNSSSSGGGSSASHSRVSGGHERGFVQPASYLRRRGLSHPMAPSQPERAVDAEEQMGLVSSGARCPACDGLFSFFLSSFVACTPSM